MKLEEEGGKWSCPAWKRVVYIKKGRQGMTLALCPSASTPPDSEGPELVITLALLAYI